MNTTLSVIKADVGSIGGHIQPSRELIEAVSRHVREGGQSLLSDLYVSSTGDDIALLMVHSRGVDDPEVHRLALDAFQAGTRVARAQGLYGAGQDLLKDAFSGNVRGMGPEVAELHFEERPNEPFLLFAADKTSPGAFNLPLYLAFADPMYCAGLLLGPRLMQGFRFVIMDVGYTEGDRVIELNAPEELYSIAALLRDTERFVVEGIFNRATGEQAAAVSTSRLRNIAGKYVGKDDPVMLVRVQNQFPATGEVLSPFALGHYVAGFMRGSHNGPLMPVVHGTNVSYFDGPPVVSCHALCVHEGRLTAAADPFANPFWDTVRGRVSEKAMEMRRQGFFEPAMLGYQDLEYGGIVELMKRLDARFKVRTGELVTP
ncbi:MAG: fructose-1,6-bisphosphate aldolase/phosphatase [Candidatus Eremiobacterota bacterium]